MARARNLKPSIFKNEILGTADPLYTILFEGLWCHADREGRLEDRPMKLKAEIFPYRNLDMDSMLSWLSQHKDGKGNPQFIVRYSVDGEKYIQIINFKKHQNPHIKEHASTIPAPDSDSSQTGDSGADRALTLNPLTLTLNPILSGSPPDAPLAEQKKNGKQLRAEALDILSFLNEKAGKRFKTVDANVDMIVARLKEGYTPTELRQIVAKKTRAWANDEKMNEYLRPATLFNKTNCAQYSGELGAPKEPQ